MPRLPVALGVVMPVVDGEPVVPALPGVWAKATDVANAKAAVKRTLRI